MSRRRSHELEDEAAESGELNLVPYLDIITTLVIFLIFTFQVIIEFRLIELLPPAYSASNPNPSDNPDEPKLTLTVIVHKDGYRIVTSDETLGASNLPMVGDKYDTKGLTEKLAQLKRTFRLGESIILMASNDIEYKHIVATMDAARSSEGQLLFPDVLLAAASVGG